MSHEPFGGKIGRTHDESEPWWPDPPRPPGRSPNVVFVLLDDTGFSHFGCYGSTIDTPHIDQLAAGGLRYTNFHTTALCSPTRASLLTGRNHHSVGMRAVSNFDTGYPHMRGSISANAATLAEMVGPHGYRTFAVGKWHLAPMHECSQAGPYDNWPLQRGFDRFYGFMQGETDQFHPELTYDNHHVDPPAGPDDGYHVSEDLVDKAMLFVRDSKSVKPEQPFFLYVAFGATHAPHQAPPEYLEKYKGRFDHGWDAVREEWFARQIEMGVVPDGTQLAPRNDGVKAWDELSENEQRFAARLQEAFAAFLDHTDAQIGRLVDFLAEMDELDDTILVVTSDNGASQEGGPTGVTDEFKYFNLVGEDIDDIVANRLDDIGGPHSHSNYPWGWAQAGNTPLKWYKQNTHGGGVRDPLVVHWPARIAAAGQIRDQFHHITDLVPTVLEELSIEAPESLHGADQMPVHGTSMSYSFDGADAPTRKRSQYFEMFGHRGIWVDGWKAVSRHWKGFPYGDDEWELYHLDEDFSETRNLARDEPEKLRELIDRWWVDAGTYGVLPLDDRNIELFGGTPRPGTPHDREAYTYFPTISHLPAEAAPRLGSRSWDILTDVTRGAGDDGVLVAQGSHNSGFSLFVQGGRLAFDYNRFTEHTIVWSDAEVPVGRHMIGVRFRRDGDGADVEIVVDATVVGSGRIPAILRMLSSTGMDVGRDNLSPVTDLYDAPFPFTGTIHRLHAEIRRRADVEAEREAQAAEARTEMARE